MIENCPFHIFKIRFYDCKSFQQRKEIENLLRDCGALLQDFHVNYKSSFHKDETIEFWYCTPELSKFLVKFSKTEWWALSDYATILAGVNLETIDWKLLY